MGWNIPTFSDTTDERLQILSGRHMRTTVSGATLTSFQVATNLVTGDSSPGFHAANYFLDTNYTILATNSSPSRTLYDPGAWNDRDSGTNVSSSSPIRIPDSFTLADASGGNTPNNPVVLLNTDTMRSVLMNGFARPTAAGNAWGYTINPAGNHAGSGLSGGDINAYDISRGYINHALMILVWGKKYLNSGSGGFVSPANRADTGYNTGGDPNQYGGNVTALKMGTRVAIDPSETATSLGLTHAKGPMVLSALQNYGAYVCDNSAWDALYLSVNNDALTDFSGFTSHDMALLFAAMKIVS